MTIKELQELVSAWEYKYPVSHDGRAARIGLIKRELDDLSDAVERESEYFEPIDGEVRNILRNSMGEILWDLTSLANDMGVDLTESLIENLESRNKR